MNIRHLKTNSFDFKKNDIKSFNKFIDDFLNIYKEDEIYRIENKEFDRLSFYDLNRVFLFMKYALASKNDKGVDF